MHDEMHDIRDDQSWKIWIIIVGAALRDSDFGCTYLNLDPALVPDHNY